MRGEVLEGADTPPPLVHVRQWEPDVSSRFARPMKGDDDQARRILVRQWPQQHAVGDGKNAGRETDPEGERQHRRDQQQRRPQQRAEGVGQLAPEIPHRWRLDTGLSRSSSGGV